MVLLGQLCSLQTLPATSWPQQDHPGGVGGCRPLLGTEEAVYCRRKREGKDEEEGGKASISSFVNHITLGRQVSNGLVSIECLGDGAVGGEECLRVAVVEGKSSHHVLLYTPLLLCQS